jgi:hypothetical protein
MRRLLALALVLATPLLAEPAPPAPDALVAEIEVGVFCALQEMGKAPAPGTQSGWVHVPEGELGFHWPDRQVVPAALGLAFGVKARLVPGASAPFGEARVYRPGLATPDAWATDFSDQEGGMIFFRFDTEEELIPGLWRFEAWDGELQLYSVEFEVVPAAALPEIVQACGAVA